MKKKDFSNLLEEITQKVKNLRAQLPDVTTEELEQLGRNISSLNLDEMNSEQIRLLKPAFDELILEVNQTMDQIETLGHSMLKSMESIENQSMAVKAYAKAQHLT